MAVHAVERLQEVFEIPDHRINLGRAALVLAQLEYPELDVEDYLGQLDGFARAIEPRLAGRYDPDRVIAEMNGYLFGELCFHGNEEDYYDPRNSFLNDVIERRMGIPITLSVVYLEVARRLGLPFYGVGLPGHFLVKYDDGRRTVFIDPFSEGRLLDQEGCRELVRAVRSDVILTARDFGAVDNRYVVLRMLNNLRGIYLNQRQFRKALGVMDMVLTLLPASADEFKQRAYLHHQLRQWSRARLDLEKYLDLRPEAEDGERVKKWVQTLRGRIAMLN
jgi:regulator of sirC expression with transglutaminase-like and TPR domain